MTSEMVIYAIPKKKNFWLSLIVTIMKKNSKMFQKESLELRLSFWNSKMFQKESLSSSFADQLDGRVASPLVQV